MGRRCSISHHLFSGIIFYISLAFLFSALLQSSTERVYTLQGASITILTLLFSFLFLGEIVHLSKIIAIALLVAGGFFISFKFYRSRFFSGWQKVIMAALLSSVSLIMLKYSYSGQNFIAGYVFNRLGIFSGAILSLAIPSFRKEIRNNWKKKSVSQNTINLIGTIIAKTIAGIAMLLINYAIFLGVFLWCALWFLSNIFSPLLLFLACPFIPEKYLSSIRPGKIFSPRSRE